MLAKQIVRRGFTLVEMLVVTAIIAILATIVGLMNLDAEKEKDVQRGTELIQGALTQSKARALRDRRPSGIRLLVSTNNANFRSQIENLQEPAPFSDGWVSGTQGSTVLSGPQTGLFSFDGVQAGDTVELNGGGQKYQVLTTPALGARQISLTRPLDSRIGQPVNGRSNYRILRGPRSVAGDKPMLFPGQVIVDATAGNGATAPFTTRCLTTGVTLTAGQPVDILFSSEGAVLSSNNADVIYLHVRDLDPKNVGVESLVAIYTRTGSVFTYPLGPAGNEYVHARTGRASNGP